MCGWHDVFAEERVSLCVLSYGNLIKFYAVGKCERISVCAGGMWLLHMRGM